MSRDCPVPRALPPGSPGGAAVHPLALSDQEAPSHLPSLGLCPGGTAPWEPTPVAAVPPLGQHRPSLHCPSGPSPGTPCPLPRPLHGSRVSGKTQHHLLTRSLKTANDHDAAKAPQVLRGSQKEAQSVTRPVGPARLPGPLASLAPDTACRDPAPGPSFHTGRPICPDGRRPLSPAMPCAPPPPDGCCPPSASSQLRSHSQGRPRAQARRGPCHLALQHLALPALLILTRPSMRSRTAQRPSGRRESLEGARTRAQARHPLAASLTRPRPEVLGALGASHLCGRDEIAQRPYPRGH